MRILIEASGDHSIKFHVDRRLTNQTVRQWDSPTDDLDQIVTGGEPTPSYIDDIFSVAGIEEVWIEQHAVTVTFGRLFDCEVIADRVAHILHDHMDPDGKLSIEQPSIPMESEEGFDIPMN